MKYHFKTPKTTNTIRITLALTASELTLGIMPCNLFLKILIEILVNSYMDNFITFHYFLLLLLVRSDYRVDSPRRYASYVFCGGGSQDNLRWLSPRIP